MFIFLTVGLLSILVTKGTPIPLIDQKDESDKAECDQQIQPTESQQHELGSETESRLSDSRPAIDQSPVMRREPLNDEVIEKVTVEPCPPCPRPSVDAEKGSRLSETSIKRIERQQTHA